MILSWWANPEPDIAGYVVYYGPASSTYTNSVNVGNVTNTTVSGLVDGATYYFVLTAYNTSGLESDPSEEISVAIPPKVISPVGPPVVATMSANVSSSTSAVLNGAVNPNGGATTAWFDYGTNSNYGLRTTQTSLDSGSGTVWFTSGVSGLLPGLTYHFRASANNSAGLTSGTDLTFVTPAAPPTAASQSASNVGAGTATLNGMVNPNGSTTVAWFEYGQDSKYGSSTRMVDIGAGNNSLSISLPITDLTAGSVVHFRVVASNSAGLSPGADLSFTMSCVAATVTVQPATGVGSSTATLNGTVNPNGAPTVAWFEFGSDTTYGATTVPTTLGPSTSDNPVSMSIAGLIANLTYHYRMVASNCAGATYGADQTLVTRAASGGVGVLLSWWANPEPDISGYIIYYGVASGVYTNSINVGNVTNYVVTGLVPGSTYYFVLTAYNSSGVESDPSEEISFTIPLTPGGSGSPPTVNTASAEVASGNSAILNGTVNPNGTATLAWYEYGLTTSYGFRTTPTEVGNSSVFLMMNSYVSGLLPGASYHFRMVGSNVAGVTLGSDLTFGTPPTAPGASTQPATAVSSTTATLNAAVNPNGAATTAWFEYGTNTNYGLTTSAASIAAGNGSAGIASPVRGLLPGLTYYFRVVASSSAGTTRGRDFVFTTLAMAPFVNAQPASSIDSRTAILNGLVNPNGGATVAWYEYGPTTGYGFSTAPTAVGSENHFLMMNSYISGLSPENTYHFRMVATNIAGATFSEDVVFTTPGLLPIAVTLPPSNVTSTDASLNASVNPNGRATVVWFEYSTDANFVRTAPMSVGSGTNRLAVSSPVIGLLPGMTYNYHVVASNSVGVSTGGDYPLTIPASAPTALTRSFVELGSTTYTLSAFVDPNGADTMVWFQYGRDDTYGLSTVPVALSAKDAASTVTSPITDLLPGTTYHYRVVASNTAGTTFGVDRIVITSIAAPTAMTEPATTVTSAEASLMGYIIPNGGSTFAWFEYGLDTNYGLATDMLEFEAGNDPLMLSSFVANLVPGATYHFHLVAVNSAGWAEGDDLIFTTSAAP